VFRSTLLVTTSGKTVAGLVVGETGKTVTLLTAEAKRVEVARSEIESRKTQDISAMPAGLVKTRSELRDLLAYLLAQ
jgi:putative heme-binding domain-containing protein